MKGTRKPLIAGAAGPLAAVLLPLTVAWHVCTTALQEMRKLHSNAAGGPAIDHCRSLLQEMRKLLSFVIVGGGPTGVEVAAELYDMVESDLSKIYPKLVKEAVISVIELQDHVLSTCEASHQCHSKPLSAWSMGSAHGMCVPDMLPPASHQTDAENLIYLPWA